jgi:hypothetical protein
MKRAPQDRREFLRTAARTGLLGGLGALGLYLAARDRICLRGGVCKRCVVYDRCTLPVKEKRT